MKKKIICTAILAFSLTIATACGNTWSDSEEKSSHTERDAKSDKEVKDNEKKSEKKNEKNNSKADETDDKKDVSEEIDMTDPVAVAQSFVELFNKVEMNIPVDESDLASIPSFQKEQLLQNLENKSEEEIVLQLALPENAEVSKEAFDDEFSSCERVAELINEEYIDANVVVEDGVGVEVIYQFVKDGEIVNENKSRVHLIKCDGSWYCIGFGGTSESMEDYR